MRASSFAATFALPLLLAGLSQPPALAQTTAPTGIVSLAGLRGLARPLLIFAPNPNDPQLEIQLRRLRDNAPTITELNIVVIAIPYNSPSPTQAMLTGDGAEAARRHFNIPPSDFAVILIGKDGAEKLRSSKPLSIDKLRITINAMPTRQQELRSHP
jgi:hypothetical protein